MELTAPMPAPAFPACPRKLISSASKPRRYLSPSAGGDVIQLRLPHICRDDNPL